jgi:cell division protein FtsB
MLIGFFVIGGSFFYSITRLRPLEQQIAQKQAELRDVQTRIGDETKKLDDAKKVLQATETELQAKEKEVAAKNEELRKATEGLTAIAAGQKNPAEQAKRTLQSLSNPSEILNYPGAIIIGPTNAPQSLEGTTWSHSKGTVRTVIQFLPNGRFRYQNERGQWFDGMWVQQGRTVTIVTSNGAERETGTVRGNRISGQGRNELGSTWSWTATKMS